MSNRPKADVWMPLYIEDYERATTRLSLEEDAAYMRLIRDYWMNGAPPDDDVTLARIVRIERRRWMKLRPAVAPFFTVQRGKWTHKRIEEELARAAEIIERRREAGRQGGRPKKQSESKQKPNGFSGGNQMAKQNETPQEGDGEGCGYPPYPDSEVSEGSAVSGLAVVIGGRS